MPADSQSRAATRFPGPKPGRHAALAGGAAKLVDAPLSGGYLVNVFTSSHAVPPSGPVAKKVRAAEIRPAKISESTVRRLSIYLRLLQEADSELHSMGKRALERDPGFSTSAAECASRTGPWSGNRPTRSL